MSRWLMILACWPLLMPPGLCLCRLEAFAPRPAETPAASTPGQAAAPRQGCRCCRPPAQDCPAGKAACRADAGPEAPRPCGDHAPACPASPDWEIARASFPAPPGPDLLAVLALAIDAPWLGSVEAGPGPATPAPDFSLPSSCPHLFSTNFRC
jgi:hypothetical protein